jgi:hypothetical protein
MAYFFIHLGSMHVTRTSQTQSQTDQPASTAPSKKSYGKSILGLSVFALGLNAAAAAYTTSPSDFALPDFRGMVAELLPQERAPVSIPDVVVAALSDIQSGQQRNAAALYDYRSLLQQNSVLLQQDAAKLDALPSQQDVAKLDTLLQQDAAKLDTLRSSLTDEHSDVKAISAQLSTLIAKIDSLENKMTPEMTSSIPKERARTRLSGLPRKRLARHPKPILSVREAPFSFPAATPAPRG